MEKVTARLAGLIASQHGLVTRPQALDHGVEPRHLVREGSWRLVRRGVYAPAEVWDDAEEYRARPLLQARAALMMVRRAHVASHDTAALVLGLPLHDARTSQVHLTRPGRTSAYTRAGVVYHLAGFHQRQTLVADGLLTLDTPRTVCDLARQHGFAAGVMAADAAMRRGTSREALAAAYERMGCWPHVTTVRDAVAFADPGAETPLESLARILATELGVGDVETQFPVRTPRGVLWTDLRIGNHVFEADGKQKYREVSRGGLRTVSADDASWDEKVRERLLRDVDLGVSRIFYADHHEDRRPAALERLRRDVADTVARFGAKLHPALAEDAARIRRETPRVRRAGA